MCRSVCQSVHRDWGACLRGDMSVLLIGMHPPTLTPTRLHTLTHLQGDGLRRVGADGRQQRGALRAGGAQHGRQSRCRYVCVCAGGGALSSCLPCHITMRACVCSPSLSHTTTRAGQCLLSDQHYHPATHTAAALSDSDRIAGLVVLDIAPVSYSVTDGTNWQDTHRVS